MFQNSAELLFNKTNGLLIYNDEIAESRSNDVEVKGLSDHKADNEGSFDDCVSCSLTSMLLGSRLRVKGELESKKMDELLKTLPLKK